MNGGFSGAMFDNRMENDGNMSFSGMVRHDGMMGIGWLGNHPQMAANVSAMFTWVD